MSFAAYTARLRQLSERTGAPLPYLITSFAILHEVTAIVPFVGIFFAARYHGLGLRAVEMLERAAAETDVEPGWAQQKAAQWMEEGEQFAGRLGRRYGWFGYEKGAPKDALPMKESSAGTRVAGDVANVVIAYVGVKVLLPARIAASMYLSPGFSRRVLQPLRRGAFRLFKRG